MDNLCKSVYQNDMARPRVANKTEPITTRLPPATIEACKRVAEREERPLSQVIARLLRDRLVEIGELPSAAEKAG